MTAVAGPPPAWQIVIPTIPHRHAKLEALLGVLGPQLDWANPPTAAPNVRVLAWRDNLEHSYADKLQGLYDAATASYVSSLADDDSVAPDFVYRCLAAMTAGPDQVGFRVRYTEAGTLQCPVIHSLRNPGWYGTGFGLFRDHMYYNPVRRELAAEVRFRGPYCDEEWAADLRALGHVTTEKFIDAEMLYYQRDSADNFHTPKAPMAPGDIPPRPERPWLDWLEAPDAGA
ncbi:MAG TPA: hypothetical protein VNH17_08300 [Streptosporangiaceae bacterium]|nr:hypothetical protein [Streptosporangiaceae bacterium]